MKIEEHIEELEARLNELNWHERRIGSPNATHESWGQSVELHQFALNQKDHPVKKTNIFVPPIKLTTRKPNI